MTETTWTRRNEDKPHRCPECDAVCTWDHKKAGPRTVLRHCGLRWRYGARIERRRMRGRSFWKRVDGQGYR